MNYTQSFRCDGLQGQISHSRDIHWSYDVRLVHLDRCLIDGLADHDLPRLIVGSQYHFQLQLNEKSKERERLHSDTGVFAIFQ